MSTSTEPENAFTVQSILLHQLISNAAKPNIPPFLKTILWVVAFLEPTAGILYVASAIPAIRKEGFWLLKVETNGMIRPNNCLLIPIFVLLYIICESLFSRESFADLPQELWNDWKLKRFLYRGLAKAVCPH